MANSNRLSMIRNKVETGLGHFPSSPLPMPVTEEDVKRQCQVLTRLDEVLTRVHHIAISLLPVSTPCNLLHTSVVNRDLALAIYYSICVDGRIPARGDDPELDTMLDHAERKLVRFCTRGQN